jgi:hypothetical protein
MFKLFKRGPSGPVSFEKQLSTLANCGIKLAPGVAAEALLESFDREAFEAEPYRLLLVCMGGDAESESQAGEIGYPSDNIWHFDTECIEDHGAYAAIARRMKDLAQGELPLEDITDYVDVEAGEARVAFRLAGQSYRWDAEVKDDWVDPIILSRFSDLLSRVGRSRRFTYIDLGGQDCLIGCATAQERERLSRETGLKVEWLK